MMGAGLKLDLYMIPWLTNIGPRDSDACREKFHIVGAKWMGQSGTFKDVQIVPPCPSQHGKMK